MVSMNSINLLFIDPIVRAYILTLMLNGNKQEEIIRSGVMSKLKM